MSYIECFSHMTGKNVKYNLIGVKLKHQKRDMDYGCTTDNYNNMYCNTSPYTITTYYQPPGSQSSRELNICGTSGFITQGWEASGVLSSEYHNSNTGANPVISSRTYDIEEMQVGENTEDLFSTDMIKVRITTVKKKASEVLWVNWSGTDFKKLDGTYEDKENLYLISNVILEFILLSNNEIVGSVDLMGHQYNGFFPTKFSMNSELFNLINFDPQYMSVLNYNSNYSMWFSASQQTNKGVMVNGSKETAKHDFVGLTHSLLAAEGWYDYRNGYNFKQFQIQKTGGESLTNREINVFNVNGDILFFRHMIQTQPDVFIQLNKGYTDAGLCFTPDEQTAWIDSYMAEKGYVYADPSGTHTTFMANVFNQSPILMPMYNDMFIPLTNDIKEGEAPDPDPDPEEETLEEAIDGDTDWEEDKSDGEVDYFDDLRNDVIDGMPAAVNAYRPSYSNFIFRRWRDDSTNPSFNKQVAQYFITDTDLVGTSSVLQAFFKLVTGKPDPSNIISRIYALPFEYTEILDMGSYDGGQYEEPEASGATTKECVPCYGVAGPCLGVANYNNDGDKVTNFTIHYYDRLTPRFLQIDLGEITVQKIFFNYLDYQTQYKLHLPYGAGDIEIDPSFLFRENTGIKTHVGDIERRNSGTIHLVGWIDFDSATLFIKIIINGDLYYETIVDIAIDMIPAYMGQGSIITAMGRLGMTAVGALATKGIIGKAADTLAEGTFKAGQFVRNALPHTVSIEPYFEPNMPEGLPMKDIIYGEDLSSQRFGEQVVQGMQEMASTPRLGYNGMIYGTMNSESEKPNTTVMMADKIMDQMLETNRMNQRLFNLQFPYCEVPPTNLGR